MKKLLMIAVLAMGFVQLSEAGAVQRLPGWNPATYGCPSGYHKLANGGCMRNGGLL